jgi:hypothetical protein
MPDINEAASSKFLRAVEKIDEAREILYGINPTNLSQGLYATPGAQAVDMSYEVLGHATALKVIRQSIVREWLA